MRRFFSLTMLLLAVGLGIQAQQATVRIDAQTKHQRITGFGGFVCSPQFTYNHVSTAEIKKVWGKSSTVGCNIMRGFARLSQTATLASFGVYALSASAAEFIPLDLSATGIVAVRTAEGISQPVYNLMGQKVSVSQRGLLIRNGRKYLNK